MDIERLFEELYQSIIQKKENQSKQSSKRLQNVSNRKRLYSPGRPQTFKRNNVASSNIVSETLIISSEHSAMSTYGLESETIVIKSTNSEHCTTTVCQGEDILSVKEEVLQGSSCGFSGPNCVITVADESVCQVDCESECSISQNTHEANNGYQSGESKTNDVQRLCKDCKRFYKKVRKRKQPAIIRDPRTTDPRPWYSKSWIFVNRVSAEGARKTLKRDLENVLQRLKSIQISRCTPTAKMNWTCCRSHLFLKRNIRLCKEEQKRLLFEKQGKKRKQPNSGRRSRRPKKCVSSSQAVETVSQIGKKTHKTYNFVLDSSQEEDASPQIKRYKLEIKKTGRKSLLRETETYNSTYSRMTPLDQQGVVVALQPLAIEATGHDSRPLRRYSGQIGSFREQLENMGHLKSAIINEN